MWRVWLLIFTSYSKDVVHQSQTHRCTIYPNKLAFCPRWFLVNKNFSRVSSSISFTFTKTEVTSKNGGSYEFSFSTCFDNGVDIVLLQINKITKHVQREVREEVFYSPYCHFLFRHAMDWWLLISFYCESTSLPIMSWDVFRFTTIFFFDML